MYNICDDDRMCNKVINKYRVIPKFVIFKRKTHFYDIKM